MLSPPLVGCREAAGRTMTQRLGTVVSTKFSFGTTFMPPSAFNCDIFLQKHINIYTCKHDLSPALFIVLLRLHAFGAHSPSELVIFRNNLIFWFQSLRSKSVILAF